jgi:hypothetical protein
VNIRHNLTSIFGTITSSVAASASWAERADRAFSITASIVAITVGVLTIRSILKKQK